MNRSDKFGTPKSRSHLSSNKNMKLLGIIVDFPIIGRVISHWSTCTEPPISPMFCTRHNLIVLVCSHTALVALFVFGFLATKFVCNILFRAVAAALAHVVGLLTQHLCGGTRHRVRVQLNEKTQALSTRIPCVTLTQPECISIVLAHIN